MTPMTNDGTRAGSLASLAPANLKLLAIKDGIVRVQETAGRATTPKFTWLWKRLRLPRVAPYSIVTRRVSGGQKVSGR